MAVTIIEELTDIASREDAELFERFAKRDGWPVTEIRQEANGSFTLILTKTVDEAGNPAEEDADPGDIGDGPPGPASTGVKGLLDFIAKFESGGNYNAYYGHAGNQNDPKLTSMTLQGLQNWQANYTGVNGSPSSAAGRYQIIRKTLKTLITKMGLDAGSARFTQDMQDKMAIKLLEGRGLSSFLNGSKSVEAFGNSVAMEWASMPVLATVTRSNGVTVHPGASYYSGDGLNKALTTTSAFRAALLGAKT